MVGFVVIVGIVVASGVENRGERERQRRERYKERKNKK